MAKVISPDEFQSAIEEILEEYKDHIDVGIIDAVKAVTKKGVAAVKSGSRSSFGGTGKYAKGWTSKVEKGRLETTGFIYNGKLPGLPHLLENGHANRGGGRTPGRAHIKPVEEMINKEFEQKVVRTI